MPTPIRLVQTERVVVISPADVKAERTALIDVIQELNRTVARAYQVHLELWAWEMDAFPGYHEQGPQGLIDELLVQNDADIVVGIFWHRIGTLLPDPKGETGTVHEFRSFLKRWEETKRPQILVYFKQEPYYPRDLPDLTQWEGVLKFRETLPATGFSWEFRDTAGFEALIRNHLAMVLVQKHGKSFAKGVAIVESKEDLAVAMRDIVAKADRKLWTTGSRSHDTAYFQAIEERMRDDPEFVYYRVLFGPPSYQELKDHLVRAARIPSGDAKTKRLFIGLYEQTDRQAEVSLCANEEQGLIILPSFHDFGKFDSAILFSDPGKLEALHDFVTNLRDQGKAVEPGDLKVREPIRSKKAEQPASEGKRPVEGS